MSIPPHGRRAVIVRTATGFDKRPRRNPRAAVRRSGAPPRLGHGSDRSPPCSSSSCCPRRRRRERVDLGAAHRLDDGGLRGHRRRALDTPAVEERDRRRAHDGASSIHLDGRPPTSGRGQRRLALRLTGEPTRDQIAAALEARILAARSATRGARRLATTWSRRPRVPARVAAARHGLVRVEGRRSWSSTSAPDRRAESPAPSTQRLPRAGRRPCRPARPRSVVVAQAPQSRPSGRDARRRSMRCASVLPLAGRARGAPHRASRPSTRAGRSASSGCAMVVAGIVSLVVAWLGSGAVGHVPDDAGRAALIARGLRRVRRGARGAVAAAHRGRGVIALVPRSLVVRGGHGRRRPRATARDARHAARPGSAMPRGRGVA